jgi:hypothetical protein
MTPSDVLRGAEPGISMPGAGLIAAPHLANYSPWFDTLRTTAAAGSRPHLWPSPEFGHAEAASSDCAKGSRAGIANVERQPNRRHPASFDGGASPRIGCASKSEADWLSQGMDSQYRLITETGNAHSWRPSGLTSH